MTLISLVLRLHHDNLLVVFVVRTSVQRFHFTGFKPPFIILKRRLSHVGAGIDPESTFTLNVFPPLYILTVKSTKMSTEGRNLSYYHRPEVTGIC